MKAFAYKHPVDEIRLKSSSGGLFSELALSILSDGGVIYGAAFDDNWQVKHIRIESESELDRLRGSKYVFSEFATSIANALKDLEEGRKVLFTGTPCQIGAMRKRVVNHENLLLVEVVCHGAPEPKYWDRYLDNLCKKLKKSREDIEAINFRDKSEGGWKDYAYTFSFKDGSKYSQIHSYNSYFRAFIRNYTLRDACFRCPFKLHNSQADIIIGDFWKVKKFLPSLDDNIGISLCIANTAKGVKYLEDFAFNAVLDINSVLESNKFLFESAKKPLNLENFRVDCHRKKSIIRIFNKYAGLSWKTRLNFKISNLIGALSKH